MLGLIPNSLNWDEVSWGYNSYSILKTGQDEYGKFMPLSFQAFGDFKQPVYVYASVIPINIFGLNSFAVRFPSAFFGSITIIFVFLLTYELFRKENLRANLALLSMALFAISPWSIQFSRVAFEANLGIFFTIAGVFLCAYAFRNKNLLLSLIGIIVLSISCYTYHSQKIFTPLLFIGLLVYGKNYIFSRRKVAVILIIVFLFSNLLWLTDFRTTKRGRSVMFTSQQTMILKESIENIRYDNLNQDFIGQVLHNRRLVYLSKYLENYLMHFSPNFLFMYGDNARHHAPDNGLIYLVSLPFIIIGMVNLVKKKSSNVGFLFFWLLTAPIASALAVDAPNASRSLVFLPTWQIITAYGIITTISNKTKFFKLGLIFSILFLYTANFIYYIHNYFNHTDTDFSPYWQYGYREAVLDTKSEKDKPIIYLSDLEQPYIFYLFYTKKEPSDYLRFTGSSVRRNECFTIDNAFFGKCEDKIKPNTVVISDKFVPDAYKYKRKDITHPNGDKALSIYRIDK